MPGVNSYTYMSFIHLLLVAKGVPVSEVSRLLNKNLKKKMKTVIISAY